jgi:hypothetical protein
MTTAMMVATAICRQAGAGDEIGEAGQEGDVIGDETDGKRPPAPHPEEGAVQRHRADHRQQQRYAEKDAAGEIERHQFCQQRHNKVHAEIGDDVPGRREDAGEHRITAGIGEDEHAREMIGVIEQRRHRRHQQRHDQDRQQRNQPGAPRPGRARHGRKAGAPRLAADAASEGQRLIPSIREEIIIKQNQI